MPPVHPPSDQWLVQRLNQHARDIAALARGYTNYITDSTSGVAHAIVGKVTHDPEGKETGLDGFGIAVHEPDGEAWAKLAPSTAMSWKAPTLESSWTGTNVGYFKDALGFVHIMGVVSGGATATSIFTLPQGFRPTHFRSFACCAKGGGLGTAAFAGVTINNSGNVILNAGSTSELDLGGIAPFLAEA